MTLRKKARTKFVRYLGKQFRDDKTLLQVYSRDMAELPSTTKLLIKNIPDGIILPRNIKDIQQAYKVANETRVPLIPRSAGTSGFGGSIPYKKGVILDGKGLESDIIVEPFDQSVLVSPSMVFSELQRYLKMQGVSLCVFPSSYYSATLGGFIAHGGYGVGSAQYGGWTFLSTRVFIIIFTSKRTIITFTRTPSVRHLPTIHKNRVLFIYVLAKFR